MLHSAETHFAKAAKAVTNPPEPEKKAGFNLQGKVYSGQPSVGKRFACSRCPQIFEQINLLMVHAAQAHPNQHLPFSCLLCPKKFGLKEQLRKHSDEEHSGKNIKMVKDIHSTMHETSGFRSQLMGNPARINARQKLSPVESSSANPAQRSIVALSNFKQPLIKESIVKQTQKKPSTISSGNWFCCKFCSVTFPRKKLLMIHCEKQHNKVIPTKEILPIIVPEKNKACTVCPEKFRMKKDLDLHLAQVHQQEVKKSPPRARNFACAQCPESFAMKKSLIKHARLRHPQHVGPQAHQNQAGLPKTFACALCPAAYEGINDLVIHSQNVHSISTHHCPETSIYCRMILLSSRRRNFFTWSQKWRTLRFQLVIHLRTWGKF